ncbi:MAG TPA: thiamine diphosphokinase [Acidimicrobiia bacterium]
MGARVAWIFSGGDPPSPSAIAGLPVPDMIVAADSGVEHALALGCSVDVVVGDLDSADPAALDAAVAAGAILERHPVAKEATDLELAFVTARVHGCGQVVVIGGHGGRLDHLLGNALLLASPDFADLQVEARMGEADVVVVHDAAELHGRVGDVCSLVPVGGPAAGVRTRGLRFPLHGEVLHPGSTRGVSNELLEPVAHVALEHGVLLAVLPNARKAS